MRFVQQPSSTCWQLSMSRSSRGSSEARRPAPQHLAALDDRGTVAGVGQAHRRGQAGKPAPDHGDHLVGHRFHL